jgi:leucyl/phenylalanyl-tRNA--protein transferase
MSRLPWLSPSDPPEAFPPTSTALKDPSGLLAGGGDLSPQRLLAAYSRGIFPWYSPGEPVLWWAPDPREVIFPERFHASRSLLRTMNRGHLTISHNRAFDAVVGECAAPRARSPGTWISPAMRAAYSALHQLGHAHSVEIWQGNALVGGLYGVRVGQVFCGESMFSRVSDASKLALYALLGGATGTGIALLDCQMASTHLRSLGSCALPRAEFECWLQTPAGAQAD